MQKELIYSASKLFPTFEHWQSFLELANCKDAIVTSWFIEATTKIRRHFIETLPTEWDCAPWGTTDLDTRWFLKQFGPDSLTVSFSFHYRLDLRLENRQKYKPQTVTRFLKESDCRPIYLAFDRIDKRFDWGSELIENRNYKFGTAHDGNFEPFELAWYAAHQTNAFVDQAITKIEHFTKSTEVTELLRQINQTAMDESQPVK